MEIERLTGKLLFTHNCVIIPGFGGFVANPAGASIHPGRHTFSPPYKAILFNRSLVANDGLVANSLVHSTGLTYADAVIQIEKFVNQANAELRNRKKVSFPELGYLQADIEGNISFYQDGSINFDFNSFGLDEFQSLPAQTQVQTFKRQTVKTDRVVPLTKANPRRTKKTSRRTLAIGTGLALVLAVGSFFTNLGISSTNQNMAGLWSGNHATTTAQGWVDYTPSLKIRASVIMPDSLLADSLNTPVTITEPVKTVAAPITVTKVGGKVHVIAGCFESYKNAEKYKGMLKDDGLESVILDKKNTKMYKVSLASFDKTSQASHYIASLADSLQTNVWIYSEK